MGPSPATTPETAAPANPGSGSAARPHRDLTSFVGREAVLRDLTALVARPTPLITIAGPPGIGKTRVARRLTQAEGEDASTFCDLRGVETPTGFAAKLAESLDAHLEAGPDLSATIETVAGLLVSQKRRLVVLDNFEQLVPEGTEPILEWLGAAPGCCFVVTSRRMLRVRCETVFELPPLALGTSPNRMSEAATLFIERAKAAEPAFDENGLPDVEKLVAPRSRHAPRPSSWPPDKCGSCAPHQLLKQLEKGPTIALEASERDIEPRHRSMRATIEASWSALEPYERAALSQLTVCRQGFTLETCRAILDLEGFPDAPSVGEVVRTLREASLIHVSAQLTPAEPLRWDMYEAIREYAAGFPTRGADARHADHYTRLGRHWTSKLGTPEEASARGSDGSRTRESPIGDGLACLPRPNRCFQARRACARALRRASGLTPRAGHRSTDVGHRPDRKRNRTAPSSAPRSRHILP